MRLSSLSRRYTAALFDTACDANLVDKIESDLGLITWTLQSIAEFKETLANPLISTETKKSAATAIFRDKVDAITLNFVCLLIDRRREDILEDIEEQFALLADDWRGIIRADVTSAAALTDNEKSRLISKLEAFTSKKVELYMKQDRSLIGGLVVRIGDTVIDGSIKKQVVDLKNRMLGKE